MALEHDCHALPDRGARRIRAPGDLTPSSTPIAVRRSQQRRVPRQPRRASPAASKSFRLPKQAQVSSVIFQAQYQAFVRFAVKGSAAFSSHRAQRDLLLWNLYSGRAHSLEILALTLNFREPAALHRRYTERSRSWGIFQVVFLHSNQALSGQFPPRDRPRDARQIGLGWPCRR